MFIVVVIVIVIAIVILLPVPICLQTFLEQNGCNPELKTGMVMCDISKIDQLISRNFPKSMIEQFD
jgi:hypothetical protein